MYLNNGDGTFAQQFTYTLPGSMAPTTNPVRVGDFNGDGIPDIGYRHQRDELSGDGHVRIRVLQGVGDGTFILASHIYDLPALSYPFVGADFDGDGKTDLVELTGDTASFHTIPAAAGPALDIRFNSSPILGLSGSATVTLNLPAVSSQTVNLSASDRRAIFPKFGFFLRAKQEENFLFALGANFDSTYVLALYATLGTQTAVAYAQQTEFRMRRSGFKLHSSPCLPSARRLQRYSGRRASSSRCSYSARAGTQERSPCSNASAFLPCTCSFDAASIYVYADWISQVTLTVSTSTSTPYGMYPVQIIATDGFFPASVTLPLGVGNFSLGLNPSLVVVGPYGLGTIAVTSTSTNGLSETITLSCSGLPASATCSSGFISDANGGSSGVFVGSNGLAVGDYAFEVVGTANIASQSAPAILRVGDFTASLDKTTATLAPGQSATFTVTLTSLNHYTSSISVICESPSSPVTCSASPLPATLTDNGTAAVR